MLTRHFRLILMTTTALFLVALGGCKRKDSTPAPDVPVKGEKDDKSSSVDESIVGLELPSDSRGSARSTDEDELDVAETTREPVPADGAAFEVRTVRKAKVFVDGAEQPAGQRRFVFKGLETGNHVDHEVKVQLPNGDLLKRKIILQKGWDVVVPLVSRPVDLELAEQTGHSGVINSVAFSPDGAYVVTGSADHTAILWETSTARQLRVCRGHSQPITAVAFRPGGKHFITGSSDCSVILWDVESGNKLRNFKGHEHGISAVAFHPDGKRFVSAANYLAGEKGKPDFAILWDADTGKQDRIIPIEQVTGLCFDKARQWLYTASEGCAISCLPAGTPFAKTSFGESKCDDVALSPDGKQYLAVLHNGKVLLRDCEKVDQDIATFEAHTNLLMSKRQFGVAACFSPDGSKVLSACDDGIAILYDRKTLQAINRFQGRKNAAFHPNGEQILTVNGTGAILWDVISGEPVRVFKGHTSPATATVNSSGNQFLGAYGDGSNVLWDATFGERRQVFYGHTNWVTAVAFSPDHRYLLTGSDDSMATVWDRETRQAIRTFVGHTGGITCVAVSPNGRLMATGAGDQSVILWEVGSGRQIYVLKDHSGAVASVAFDAAGKQLLSASADRTAILWDVLSGRMIRKFEGHTEGVTSAVFSGDDKYVLTGSDDKQAILWDRKTGDRIRSFVGHTAGINAVAITFDAKYVATASSDKKAMLWDTATGKKLTDLEGHSDSVSSLAFSPDGRRLVTGSWDHSAILWDIESRERLSTLTGHSEPVSAVAMRDDGREAATGSLDGTCILWDAGTGRRMRELHGLCASYAAVSFRPDSKQVVTDAIGADPILWDVATGMKVRTFKADEGAVLSGQHAVSFSPDNRRLVTAASFSATIWDADTGKEQSSHSFGREQVGAMAFTSDGSQVLSVDNRAGSDLELWDATTGNTVRTLKGNKHQISMLAFTRGGDRFVAASSEGDIVLWDFTREVPMRTFNRAGSGLSTLALSPDGNWMVTGSSEKGVLLWDVANGEVARQFQGRANSVSFANEGRYLVTTHEDGTLRLWDIATGDNLCRMMNIDRGEDWAVVTPEGLFDGSRGGREKVAFRIGDGLDVVPLDRFFQDCYYPSLLAEIWRGERPLPGKPLRLSPAPVVKMLVNRNPEGASANQVWVDLAVTDKGGGIKGPWVQHNGVTLAAGQQLSKSGNTLRYRYVVSLLPGDNRIEARAGTANGGVESEPAITSIKLDGEIPKPDLYAVVIGINHYAKDSGVPDLDCCVADAQAIGDLLKSRAGKFYGKVEVTPLVDEQASKANILKAVTDLSAKARPQDVFVLYIASHGYTVGQRFYLFPHDFRLEKAAKPSPVVVEGIGVRGYRGTDEQEADVREHGLAIDELGEALAQVPALKRVLIFDTCHSGSAVALAGKKLNPFAFRGAMERFSRAQGVYSLAATSADELAAENNAELGHSILTYTLLAGAGAVRSGPLKAEAAKHRLDDGVDVLEWFRYARERVPALYQKYVGRRQQVELSGDDQPSFVLLSLKAK